MIKYNTTITLTGGGKPSETIQFPLMAGNSEVAETVLRRGFLPNTTPAPEYGIYSIRQATVSTLTFDGTNVAIAAARP